MRIATPPHSPRGLWTSTLMGLLFAVSCVGSGPEGEPDPERERTTFSWEPFEGLTPSPRWGASHAYASDGRAWVIGGMTGEFNSAF